MNHYTVSSFWKNYDSLSKKTQSLADKNYELLKENPKHPSLHFKKVDKFWSVRIGLHYRALAVEKAGYIHYEWNLLE